MSSPIAPTLISDVLAAAVNGVPQIGSITIHNDAFMDIGGNMHPAATQTVYVDSQGHFNVELAPNAGANPPTAYYTVSYELYSGAGSISDFWLVPVTAKTLAISDVRVNVNLPPPPFLIPISQINCITALIGTVPTWNGSSLEMLPLRALFPGTFTTDSGFHVLVTGATHGQGVNIITRWRDSSGNDQNPSVTVDPISGDVNAWFGSATTGRYFIDGGQAIPNFAEGFYGASSAVITSAQHHFASPDLDVAVYDYLGNLINTSVQIQVNPATYTVTVTLSAPANFRVVIMGGMGTALPINQNATAFLGIGLKAGTPTNGQVWAYNSLDKLWELANQSGTGGSSTPPYLTSVSSQSSLSIQASTHGQGLYPVVFCFASDGTATESFYSRDGSGNLALLFDPPFSGEIQVMGAGSMGGGAAPYVTAVSGSSSLTISAATHGQGTYPVVTCFDSTGAAAVSDYSRDGSGNVTISFDPPFTGTVQVD